MTNAYRFNERRPAVTGNNRIRNRGYLNQYSRYGPVRKIFCFAPGPKIFFQQYRPKVDIGQGVDFLAKQNGPKCRGLRRAFMLGTRNPATSGTSLATKSLQAGPLPLRFRHRDRRNGASRGLKHSAAGGVVAPLHAQCSELAADNRLVGGSSPPSSTTQLIRSAIRSP